MDEALIRDRMQKSLDSLLTDIGSIRTGRATPSLISELVVGVYGGTQRMRILELASITAPDPQTLMIDPWDKSITGEIKKGIMAANIGLNPVEDREYLRISLPPITLEDREKFVKLLHAKLEASRVTIRQIRADAMKNIKTAFEKKELTEDTRVVEEEKVQKLTDEFVGKINEAGEKKEKELMGE